MRVRSFACVGALVALSVAGCTSGDDDDGGESSDTTEAPSDSGDGAAASGAAPGVTDDTIKIGVTHVDASALTSVGLDYDLGDHQAVYQALADNINADGGINGRQIELVFAPIDPTSPAPAEEACLKLTEDDDVFLVTGFFLDDAVLCPVDVHATAVVGGGMNPERLEAAKAPWITAIADTDQPEQVVRAFDERGELDGNVAVFAAVADQSDVDDIILPTLDDLGIEPVETGIVDAPANDTAALQANVKLIAERFKAADADTVLIAGASGAQWPQAMADDPYRPKLLFVDVTAPRAFGTSAANPDTSVLDDSLSGGGYGPDQERYDEATMQECVAIIEDAGAEAPPPSEFDVNDRSNQPYQAAFQACPDMDLVRAWLEAAGEDLNYDTLEAAIDGLEVSISGDPTPRTYGPPPAADGNPEVYFFTWNSAIREFELSEE